MAFFYFKIFIYLVRFSSYYNYLVKSFYLFIKSCTIFSKLYIFSFLNKLNQINILLFLRIILLLILSNNIIDLTLSKKI